MRPPFLFRSCTCRSVCLSAAIGLLMLGSTAGLGASPGATFQELPEASVSVAFTLQLASQTANVLTRITTIPEPASCLLFGTAAVGLLAIRRRLRQRS